MEFDAFILARLQFAFTIAFHILFPTLTVGLGAFLVLIEGL
jgi:cytochrome bd ubiquinol oxidase subunit I